MPQEPICRLTLSGTTAQEDIEQLKTTLRLSSLTVEQPEQRVMGLDDIALLIGIAAGGAQLIDYGIKVSQALIQWRRNLKQKGVQIEGKLEHPQKPPIDLEAASDEDVEQWLSQ